MGTHLKFKTLWIKNFFTCNFFHSFFNFFNRNRETTYTFAERADSTLQLDIYKAKDDARQPVLVFVFGGGFTMGTRDQESYLDYYRYFAENGFTVVAIDYRLGLKGAKTPSVFNHKPLRRANSMAVEDLYAATDFLIKRANELQIDTSKIIISGSRPVPLRCFKPITSIEIEWLQIPFCLPNFNMRVWFLLERF